MYILSGNNLSHEQKNDIENLLDDVVLTFETSFFDENINSLYFLLYSDGILIGCMIADNATIHYLAIHPDYRRQGYGRKLVSLLPNVIKPIYGTYSVTAMPKSIDFWKSMLKINPYLNIEYLYE